MTKLKGHSIIMAGVALMVFAAAAYVVAPIANAQAMGEYGAVVGNSATVAASAPAAELPGIPGTAVQNNSSGTSTTELREDDSAPQDPQVRQDGGSQSGDEWTQVKESGEDQ